MSFPVATSRTLQVLPKVINQKPNLKQNPTEYSNACAALNIKPNSMILKNEKDIMSQETVLLNGNYLGGKGFEAVTALLMNNKELRHLDVSDNGLTNESVIFLTSSIADLPNLTSINLSNNHIGSPSAIALVNLLRRNSSIKSIILDNTNMDEAMTSKIARILSAREKADAEAAAAAEEKSKKGSSSAIITPFQRAKANQVVKAEEKREKLRKERLEKEYLQCEMFKDYARELLKDKNQQSLTIPRCINGWRVFNVCISCTPGDFYSEQNIITEFIVPNINKIYEGKKVFIHPVFMHNNINPHRYENAVSVVDSLAIPIDYEENILKSFPFFVQLIGEKIGLREYDPAITDETPNLKHFKPVIYREYEKGFNFCPYSIVMMRASVDYLKVPPSFLSRFTDDVNKVLLDEHSRIIREKISAEYGNPPKLGFFDPGLEKEKWSNHLKFIEKIKKEHPSSMLCTFYPAKFDSVTPSGDVILKELDVFVDLLTKRLISALDAYLDFIDNSDTLSIGKSIYLNFVNENLMAKGASLIFASNLPNFRYGKLLAHALKFNRKTITGKLDLYALTPPSRNMMLIHGPSGRGAAHTIRAFIKHSYMKPSYIVVHHCSNEVNLFPEPSDLRTMFISFIYQLDNPSIYFIDNPSDAKNSPQVVPNRLPLYILSELNIDRLQKHFTHALARVAGDNPDKTIIIVIDGLDKLDPMLIPNASMRISDTGVNTWDIDLIQRQQQEGQKENTVELSNNREMFSFIPVCLAKNVRFVGSCASNSPPHKLLEIRGRDSCEPLYIPELSDYEIEQYLTQEIKSNLGIPLSEAAMQEIMRKTCRRSLDYLNFIKSTCEIYKDMPTAASLASYIASLPDTIQECCVYLIELIERHLGEEFTRKAITLLRLSRWGLTEIELGELIAKCLKGENVSICKNDTFSFSSSSCSIPGDQLNKFIRLLSPVIPQYVSIVSPPMNAFERVVCLQNVDFISEATKRYETSVDETNFHTVMAHYYHKLMFLENHPLQPKALKECAYHAISGRLWALVDHWMFNIAYLSKGFELGLGYQVLREYIRSYNTLESYGKSEYKDYTILTEKMKEYSYFVKDNSVNLSQYPWLAYQIAIAGDPQSFLYHDAQKYYQTEGANILHFISSKKSKGKIHRCAVTDCAYSPSGMRFASCSEDRSVKIYNASGDVLYTMSQSVTKLKKLSFNATSHYLVTEAEDRYVFVYDTTSSTLVSKFLAHEDSPITDICLSVRGRFIASGTEDNTLRCWLTEEGISLASASLKAFSDNTTLFNGVRSIVPHPVDEYVFYMTCNRNILRWTLNQAQTEMTCDISINAYSLLPIGSLALAAEGTIAFSCSQATSVAAANAAFIGGGIRGGAHILQKPSVNNAETSMSKNDNNTLPGSLVSEAYGKIWFAKKGNHIANLAIINENVEASFGRLSPNEKNIVIALVDGSLAIYSINLFRLSFSESENSSGEDHPFVVPIVGLFKAFKNHVYPNISHIVFSHDSAMVAATGNLRQLKVFNLKIDEQDEQYIEKENSSGTSYGKDFFSKLKGNVNSNNNDNSNLYVSSYSIRERANLEFLLDSQISCIDWSKNPHKGAPELILGDISGRIHLLSLVQGGTSKKRSISSGGNKKEKK